MQLNKSGIWLFAIGLIAGGILGLLGFPGSGKLPEVWFDWQPLGVIAVALGLLFQRTRAVAGGLVAAFSLFMLVSLGSDLIRRPHLLRLWVGPAHMLTFASVGIAVVRPGFRQVARVTFGIAVAMCGGTHLFFTDEYAGQLPDWLLVPKAWLYLTGLVQLAAGSLIAVGLRASTAAFAIGFLWLSWIPLMFMPLGSDANGVENQMSVALLLLALAGAAWVVGERASVPSGEDLPSRSH
jgi:uncharacterized membrane protein